MLHKEKVERHLETMTSRGVSAWTVAPPLFRLLWAFGSEVRPPLYLPASRLGWLTGTFFAGLFGVVAWPLVSWLLDVPVVAFLSILVPAGVAFGVALGKYYEEAAKAHNLPSWEEV